MDFLNRLTRVLQFRPLCTGLAAAVLSAAVNSGELKVLVTGNEGAPLQDAVVYVLPGPATESTPAPVNGIVDQVKKAFVPHVAAVQVGGQVSFPNYDNIRHHVYSFSKPKKFEIPLYEGVPSNPITFDRPGVVALGCNIHDWMSGYIVVTETPWFAITGKDGSATLADLPAGAHTLEVWHETLKGKPDKTRQQVQVGDGTGQPVRFSIKQKKVFSAFRGVSARSGGYR